MQLVHNPASPFVRKVKVVLIETGQQDAVDMLDVVTTPTNTHETAASANPLGKIPALIRPDAPTLYDSRVICRFLDNRAAADLYPEGRIWDVLTLEATADGIMDAAVLMVYEFRVRDEGERSPAWVEAQWAKIVRTLDVVNARWMSHLYGPFDMGQIAIGCALGYLDFRHGDRDWRNGRDALAAWYKTHAERPSMQATVPG